MKWELIGIWMAVKHQSVGGLIKLSLIFKMNLWRLKPQPPFFLPITSH
jgi:hypothetical protein